MRRQLCLDVRGYLRMSEILGLVDTTVFGVAGPGSVVRAAARRQGRRYGRTAARACFLDDADLATAVDCAANGAFFSTGQRCTASSRLIVTEGIHDRFVAALIERMKSLVVGDALDPDTHIGPVVDGGQFAQNLSYVDIGVSGGAHLAFGDETLERGKPGYYMRPALFTEADNSMRIAREEIFGPVACVLRVKNYEEALATANDTSFGLSAGICATSLKHARHFKRHVEAGVVAVNLPTAGIDFHVPFGGRKASSYGPREQGRYAAEFYTTVKTAYTLPG